MGSDEKKTHWSHRNQRTIGRDEMPTNHVISRTTNPGFEASGRDGESAHWTVVLQAARTERPGAMDAFGRLHQRYWQPAYGFVQPRSTSREAAEDL